MYRLNTQISAKDHRKLGTFIRQLQALDINVTHPKGRLLFSKEPWWQYESEMEMYEAIENASFHIVWNVQELIDADMAREILYAIHKQRTLILVEKPSFTPKVDSFTAETISTRLGYMTIANLGIMAPAELNYTLKNLLKTTDYQLPVQSQMLIRSQVKAHFRQLAASAHTNQSRAVPAVKTTLARHAS